MSGKGKSIGRPATVVRGDSASTINLHQLLERRSASTANFQAVTASKPQANQPANQGGSSAAQSSGGTSSDKK